MSYCTATGTCKGRPGGWRYAGGSDHVGNVYAVPGEPLDGVLAEQILPHPGDEGNLCAGLGGRDGLVGAFAARCQGELSAQEQGQADAHRKGHDQQDVGHVEDQPASEGARQAGWVRLREVRQEGPALGPEAAQREGEGQRQQQDTQGVVLVEQLKFPFPGGQFLRVRPGPQHSMVMTHITTATVYD